MFFEKKKEKGQIVSDLGYVVIVVLVAKSNLTLCDPLGQGPSVHGISQARIQEWVAISFSRGSSWTRNQTCISCIVSGFFTAEPPGKPRVCGPRAKLKTPFRYLYEKKESASHCGLVVCVRVLPGSGHTAHSCCQLETCCSSSGLAGVRGA